MHLLVEQNNSAFFTTKNTHPCLLDFNLSFTVLPGVNNIGKFIGDEVCVGMIDNFNVILKERYVTCINLLCLHFASSFITAILLHPSCGAYIN
jgi:hypothetical protein